MTLKRCSRCKNEKPLADFTFSSSEKDGRSYRCKPCDRSYVTPASEARSRRNRVRNRHGAEGLVVLERIFDGEACEICGGFTTKMSIDHDHKTGEVRGLLCSNCNAALGMLKEDPRIVNNLLAYLARFTVGQTV